jgi:hypothetical protein
MKRILIIGIPLSLLTALMFVRPPSFTSTKTPAPVANTGVTGATGTTGATSQTGVKPGVTGSGEEDDEGKPAYGGHDADDYDD